MRLNYEPDAAYDSGECEYSDNSRYYMPHNRDDPDEKFKYRLYDEIAPFNLLLRTKIGLRLSVFHILEGYEHPFHDSLNHQQITSSLPGDEKTGRPISENCFSMLMLFLFRLPLKSHFRKGL
ncbi:MAG: hypothetical protein ACQER7_11970 [Bacteroidota bacterium]